MSESKEYDSEVDDDVYTVAAQAMTLATIERNCMLSLRVVD